MDIFNMLFVMFKYCNFGREVSGVILLVNLFFERLIICKIGEFINGIGLEKELLERFKVVSLVRLLKDIGKVFFK